jgi:hypothetical protein
MERYPGNGKVMKVGDALACHNCLLHAIAATLHATALVRQWQAAMQHTLKLA